MVGNGFMCVIVDDNDDEGNFLLVIKAFEIYSFG
jgi:hypothetical protein